MGDKRIVQYVQKLALPPCDHRCVSE